MNDESSYLCSRQHSRPACGISAVRLRELAEQRGIEVVQTYQDCGISGSRARRPGLDALMADARKKKFSAVLVTAFDRVARSVKHFLQTIDELESLGVVFISRREQVDTSGMMG